MSSSSDERGPIDLLADEFLARHKCGEKPTIKEYCARHPELADDIRDVFEALLMVEDLKPGAADVSGVIGDVLQVNDQRLERVGDYQILRELGRGGMGVVYEAQQLSLGRHVALKVLAPYALLEPRQLGRFQREARAAARLHHTNIVPVYGVGEQDGLHYYVMQFIPGLGLDAVLVELQRLRRRGQPALAQKHEPGLPPNRTGVVAAVEVAQALLTGAFRRSEAASWPTDDQGQARPVASAAGDVGASTPVPGADSSATIHLPGQTEGSTLSESGRQYWQSVARVGMQVADALAYAASQGILHRDIKPSNLLLDEQGIVWVTDFGLAKADSDGDNLTHTGDIVGTLRYMAPERFNGQGDVRSDVYGLGLTLYELLTLRPAFDEADRNRLVKQVMHDEPVRPRKLNRAIPADLETVVLKAIARAPAHRYQAPAELAEDLKCFVEDRPIRARRVSGAEKFWRWCHRNPLPAGLLAGMVLVFLMGFAGVFWQWRQAEAAREDEQSQRKAAELARDHAKAQEAKAQEAKARAELEEATAREVGNFLSGLLEETDPFAITGRSFGARKQDDESQVIARKLLDRGVENLKTKLKDKPEVRAALLNKIGTIYISFGETARAKPLLEEALELRRAKLGEHHADVATSWHSLGYFHTADYNHKKAIEAYQQALAIRTKLFGNDHPLVAETMFFLALTRVSFTDGHEVAIELLHKAIDINRRHFGKESREYAFPLLTLAQVHLRAEEPLKALPLLNEGIALVEKIEGKKGLGAAIELLFQSQFTRHVLKDLKTAARLCQECVERAEPLLGEMHWVMLHIRSELADLHLSRPHPDYEAAEKEYRLVLDRAEAIFGKNSIHLGPTLMNLGRVYRDSKRYPEAEKVLRRSADLGRSATGPPLSYNFQRSLTILGFVLNLQNKFAEAEPVLEEVVAARRKDAEVKDLYWLGNDMQALVRTLLENGKRARATEVYRENLPTLAQQTKPKGEHLLRMALCQAHFCSLIGADPKALTSKEQEESRRSADAAMASLHAAVADGFRDVNLLNNAAEFATIRSREDFRALVQKLVSDDAPVLFKVGEGFAARGQWDQAASYFDKYFTMGQGDHFGFCQIAALPLYRNDLPAYRRNCKLLLERYGTSENPQILLDILYWGLLVSDEGGPAEELQRLADRIVDGTETHPTYKWMVMTKGMADYRAGQFDSAVKWLLKAKPLVGNHAGIEFYLSMAYHRLNQPDHAKTAYQEALRHLTAYFGGSSDRFTPGKGAWYYWPWYQVLRREAEAVLNIAKGPVQPKD